VSLQADDDSVMLHCCAWTDLVVRGVHDSLIYVVLYFSFALSSFPIPVGSNLLKPMDLHESIQYGRFVLGL
jgi:hypothetical protein